MQIQVEDLAKQQLIDIYYYNYQFSLKNAIETDKNIRLNISNLEKLYMLKLNILYIELCIMYLKKITQFTYLILLMENKILNKF